MFDTETTGLDINSCSIVELAAVVIDPVTLNIVPNSEFEAKLKPDMSKDDDGKYLKDMGAVQFHAENKGKIEKRYVTQEEILKEWEGYPEPSEIWPQFLNYLRRYHIKQSGQSKWTAPIPGGHNIRNYDIPIVERYHAKYGDGKAIWNPRDRIDLLDYFHYWFEGAPEIKSYSMDSMRKYLGMSSEGAHTAIVDVIQCAEVICRFLRFQREVAKSKGWFKNAFAKTA